MRVHNYALSQPPEGTLRTIVDDHSVIAASLERPEVFGELFERHAPEMHRFLSRRLGDLADDLLGDLFATAFERRVSYRAELADARPWLYGIGANLVRAGIIGPRRHGTEPLGGCRWPSSRWTLHMRLSRRRTRRRSGRVWPRRWPR